MMPMRTMLTLDPDVARMLANEAHRLRKPFKQVVNDAPAPRAQPRIHRPRPPAVSRQAPYGNAARRPRSGAAQCARRRARGPNPPPRTPPPGPIVIVPDINLLLYAHFRGFTHHVRARRWWEQLLNGDTEVALSAPAVFGFLRLATSPAVFDGPLAVADAVGL